MADNAADYRARAAANLAEAAELELAQARQRMLLSAERWTRMADAIERRAR